MAEISLVDRVREVAGKVLYPPIDALCRYEQTAREERQRVSMEIGESLAPEETFLADTVRGMYRTLKYFEIPDPRREAVRRQRTSDTYET